jgi:hypothetical protein
MNGPNATVASAPVRPKRSLSWVGPALVITFAAILMAWAARLVTNPKTLDHIRIVNPVEQSVDVDVKKPGGAWLPLAAVDAQSSTTVEDVIDVDGPWIIRFRVSNDLIAEVRRSHESLERDHYRIVVPTRAN